MQHEQAPLNQERPKGRPQQIRAQLSWAEPRLGWAPANLLAPKNAEMAHIPDLQAQLVSSDPEAVALIAVAEAWWNLADGRPLGGWLVLKADLGVGLAGLAANGRWTDGSQFGQIQIVAAYLQTKRPILLRGGGEAQVGWFVARGHFNQTEL
jgi:hypothetical protein